jgi:hypothetical protein
MQVNSLKFIVFFTSLLTYAQEFEEFTVEDHIKSIQFSTSVDLDLFPVVQIGEPFTLRFDDLHADEADYYYKIKHFNYDWTPSILFQNEYMEGYDNLRIDNYQTSFNTLQKYTHYQLTIPNADVQLKVSGNYMIEVYSADDELIFSRRFCVYENSATVQAAVYRPQNMDRFATHQSVRFAVTPNNRFFVNPEENVKVVLLQNQQWNSLITHITPQYYSGKTLEYRYETPTQFEGGNEYLFFDTKDLRISTPKISYSVRADLYETYLNIDIGRSFLNYTYAPDINGDYQVRNTMRPGDSHVEADYSFVHFSLAFPTPLEENESLFVYGAFNNFELNELNKLYYNPSLDLYEGIILLKQGFYNYKYALKQGDVILKNRVSGSHSVTENEYLILLYYRDIGAQFDALVGVGRANSFALQN